TALGLAAEGAAEPPWAHLYAEPRVMGDRDHVRKRPGVVRKVVLRERVEDSGVAARSEIGHVAPDVADDPHSEVRTACTSGQYHSPSHRSGGQTEGDAALDEQEE